MSVNLTETQFCLVLVSRYFIRKKIIGNIFHVWYECIYYKFRVMFKPTRIKILHSPFYPLIWKARLDKRQQYVVHLDNLDTCDWRLPLVKLTLILTLIWLNLIGCLEIKKKGKIKIFKNEGVWNLSVVTLSNMTFEQLQLITNKMQIFWFIYFNLLYMFRVMFSLIIRSISR